MYHTPSYIIKLQDIFEKYMYSESQNFNTALFVIFIMRKISSCSTKYAYVLGTHHAFELRAKDL